MPTKVRLSRRALAWAQAEAAYLAERDPRAADGFLNRLDRAILLLSRHPEAGAPGEVVGTRRLVTGAYLITYRSKQSMLEIAAIRHARQRDARTPQDLD